MANNTIPQPKGNNTTISGLSTDSHTIEVSIDNIPYPGLLTNDDDQPGTNDPFTNGGRSMKASGSKNRPEM